MQIDSTPTLCANSENLNANATEGWSFCQLDELVDEIIDRRGVTPLKLGSEFKANGHRVISAKLIKDDRIDLDADEPRFVDEPTYKRWMSSPLEADDVILTSEAPLGETAYIREILDWCLGQRLFGIRTRKDRLIGRFLFYALKYAPVRGDLLSRATGTTAQGIRQSELRRVRIPTPPLPEQRAIAHILGTLDDKIELNRRMNQTLEELARALFHSWFVAFDPVRAKAAGRQPAGMDAATAALFPDAFAESELGEIPAGWHFGKVGDLVQIAKRTLDPTAYPEESFEHYSLPAFDAGRNPVVETGAAIKSNKTIVEPGAVLISKLNPHIPRVWLPELSSERRSICSTEFLVVGPNNLSARPFIYALFTSEPFTQAFASLVTGTTGSHQRVSPESLRAMPIVVPAEQVMLRFCRAMAPLFQDRARNRALSMTLATIRETLLPKLLSGEVRVGELGVNAAQAVGATA